MSENVKFYFLGPGECAIFDANETVQVLGETGHFYHPHIVSDRVSVPMFIRPLIKTDSFHRKLTDFDLALIVISAPQGGQQKIGVVAYGRMEPSWNLDRLGDPEAPPPPPEKPKIVMLKLGGTPDMSKPWWRRW